VALGFVVAVSVCMKSMDDVASEAAAAKRAATYALLDGLDVEVLRNITAPKIAGADGERSGR
jgi:hypothetical protein